MIVLKRENAQLRAKAAAAPGSEVASALRNGLENVMRYVTPGKDTARRGTGDPDGSGGSLTGLPLLPQTISTGGVGVVNPTGVDVVDAGVQATPDGVYLTWRTVDESRVAGFHVWRRVGEQAPQRITTTPMAAQVGGQPTGMAYIFTDPALPDGMGLYELEILLIDGTSDRISLGITGRSHLIFLPMMDRP